MEDYNQFEVPAKTVTTSGLMWKTILGVVIAFAVAIPNLMEGELFLKFLYNIDSIIGFLLMSFVVTVVLGIIWATLYKSLATDRGPVINLITYVITSAFAGLFLGNALIFAVIIIGSYAQVDITMVMSALSITTGATFIAVLGGIIALPKLHMEGRAIKFFRNVSILMVSLLFISGIMWLIGMIFSIFGLTFILDLYYEMVYGLGPVSIFFSILAIIGAEFMFLISLARSKYAVGREPEHMEYFYSIILVNAIIRIYVEIFKLVLKLLARSNRD